jgi:hypothetical protein
VWQRGGRPLAVQPTKAAAFPPGYRATGGAQALPS